MLDPHEPLGAFLDGELPADEAAAFERHLVGCAQCQRDLRDFSALDAVAGRAPASTPLRAVPSLPTARARLVPFALAAAAVVSVGAWLAVRSPTPTSAPLALATSRPFEARVTWAVADAWRPFEPSRAAGPQTEPLPASALAALEQAGDARALAAAWLLTGNPTRARAALEALSRDAAVLSDLSAVALVEGRDEDALALADDAVARAPDLAPAQWNRALALERLQLPRVAAAAFHRLADAHAPGWSPEAAARAARLDAAWDERVRRAQGALDAGASMVLHGAPMPAALVRAMPSWARMNFRYALLGAASAAEVEGLRPVATELDALFGGDAAVRALTAHAGLDAKQRATCSPRFRRLMVDYYVALRGTGYAPTLPGDVRGLGADAAAWVQELQRAKAPAWLVFAAPMARQLDAAWADYVAAVRADADPWIPFALELELARRAGASGDAARQEERLLDLAARATAVRAPQRALQALEQLTVLYTGQHRILEATTQGREALALARSQGDLAAELRLLQSLADAARFRNAPALSTALLEERTLRRPADCAAQAYLGESLAAMKVVSLEPAAARAALDAVRACETPLSVVGVGVLADLLRLEPREGDGARFEQAVAALRASELDASDALLLAHLEGRAWLDRDAAKGTALLRASLDAAKGAGTGDAIPKKVWAHGFGLLRAAAGEAGQWGALFTLTAEELGHALPTGCALVVEVQDNRVVAATRDAKGVEHGRAHRFPFGARRPEGLTVEELATVLAPLVREGTQACAQVSVYASYPLHGRAGWLPDELAWSYAGGSVGAAAAKGAGRGLVVHDVATPAALRLPRVASWLDAPRAGDDTLQGDAATPARVLGAMRAASFIELHVHGLVNPAQADTAALVLAPDAEGHFALSATELRATKLEGAPVVTLAACRASSVAPYLHEPWSLPRAFLEAGARAVVAAPVDLPDAEARTFFSALSERLRAGQAPATAVRDERVHFLAVQPRASWVRTVLVFD